MSVLVVGGGITGLVAARALALDGVPVTLAEAGPRLGGKVATERVDGFTLEHGPDSFLATRPAAISLARELGLGAELTGTLDPRAVFIRHNGSLVPMPEGLGLVLPTKAMPFARTKLFSWPEKARMAVDVVSPRRLGPDDVAVGTYLRSRLGSPLVDRLAGPLVGGVYGTPIDELSLDAVVPQLRTAERQHRSLLFAGLSDGRSMRRAAAARAASAARAEAAAASGAPAAPGTKPLGTFVSLRGGMDRLIDAIVASADVAGADLRTRFAVRALARSGSGVTARFSDGSEARFDAVIIAAPAPVAAVLLDDEAPGASAALDEIPHGTSILVTLAYPRDAVDHPLIGHGYLVPPSDGGAISACTWTSQKWPDRAPEGTVLLRMFVRDEGAWTRLADEALVASAREDAGRTLRITGEPLLVRVSRYEHSMPRYTVGHLRRAAAIEAAVGAWPAVTVTGASYRGVGLPDCISQGLAAASTVAARLRAVAGPADPDLPVAREMATA
ncbi:MAG: protoporphyrinogen oxidase [Chloroflexi bacterium]|nr:protoporphyrinogen oxidase [Chloroflexota bacterium]